MRTRRIVSSAIVIFAVVLVGVWGWLSGAMRPSVSPASPDTHFTGFTEAGLTGPETESETGEPEFAKSDPTDRGQPAGAESGGEGLPAPRITGMVLDPFGAPIFGASITAIDDAAHPGDPFVDDLSTHSMTDDSGAFAVECARVGSHRVIVFALGFAEQRIFDTRAGDHLEVFLSPGASISGRICYPDEGSVVAGIEVRAGGLRTEADAAGLFQIDGLEPGTTFISTESAWNGWAGAFESVELVAGDAIWVDLELRPGVTVVGRVVDRRDY